MKVTGPRNAAPLGAARRKSAASGSGETFSADTASRTDSAGAAGGLSGASAVNSVDALLALQGAGDFTQARRQASDRAFSMLDVLDEVKVALLDGGLPRSKLRALMELLRAERPETGDPRLERALDEVETRAAVELAKYDA